MIPDTWLIRQLYLCLDIRAKKKSETRSAPLAVDFIGLPETLVSERRNRRAIDF